MTTAISRGTAVHQTLAIKHGLKLWRDHHIKANRAYTPSAMMAAASRITGKSFKPRDYTGAIAALQAHLETL